MERAKEGAMVSHAKFGIGTIIRIDRRGKKITIAFDAGGEKKFVFPDAFIKYLKLV